MTVFRATVVPQRLFNMQHPSVFFGSPGSVPVHAPNDAPFGAFRPKKLIGAENWFGQKMYWFGEI